MNQKLMIDICAGKRTIIIYPDNSVASSTLGKLDDSLTDSELIYWLAIELHNARAVIKALEEN